MTITDQHNDLAFGIDRKSPKRNIKSGYSEDIENLTSESKGKLSTRRGTRSHAGILPSDSTNSVKNLSLYKSAAEEYPLVVSDGKMYKETVVSETFTVSLGAAHTGNINLGEAFHTTGVGASYPKRNGGYCTGDNVSGSLISIDSATYDETNGRSTFTCTVTDFAFGGGASAIADVIKQTDVHTLGDWLTVTQMGHSEYNGTFSIFSASRSGDTVTITVTNATGDDTTPDEVNAGGSARIITNIHTIANMSSSTLVDGDLLLNIYDDNGSIAHAFDNLAYLKESSGTTVSFEINEEQSVTNTTTLTVRGKRTSDEFAAVGNTTAQDGDMVNVGSYARPFRILESDTNVILNESIEISHGDTCTISKNWGAITVPGGTGDLVPSAPTRLFDTVANTIRSASMQDSIFFTNNSDEVMKYDGTACYRSGLPNWQPQNLIWIDDTRAGHAIEEFNFSTTAVLGSETDHREITFTSPPSVAIGDTIIDKRTRKEFLVSEIDSVNKKLIVGISDIPLTKISQPFTADVTNDYFETTTAHNFTQNMRVHVSTTTTLPTVDYDGGGAESPAILTVNTDYYIQLIDATKFRLRRNPYDEYANYDITSAGAGTHTITTQDNVVYLKHQYSYYYKINAIDINDNIVASAVTGYQDNIITLNRPGTIYHKLIGMPVFDHYDYDRIELELYRTKRNELVFYRLLSQSVLFSSSNNEIIIADAIPDISLNDSDLDTTSTALKAAEIPTATDEPPRSKYIKSVSNRLVLGNIKSTDNLNITILPKTNEEVNPLGGTDIHLQDTANSYEKHIKLLDFDTGILGKKISITNFTNASGLLQINGTGLDDDLVDGMPIYIVSGGGTTLPNDTVVYCRDVTSTTAKVSVFKDGAPLAAGTPPSATSLERGYPNSLIQPIVNLMLGYPSTTTSAFINDSGDLKFVSFGSTNLEVNDRIKFYQDPVNGTILPDNIQEDTIYHVVEVISNTSAKLSATQGGGIIAFGSTAMVSNERIKYELMDAFYINYNGTGGGDFTVPIANEWVQLLTVETNDAVHKKLLNINNNFPPGNGKYDKAGRFLGYWPIKSINGTVARIDYEHKLSLKPDGADDVLRADHEFDDSGTEGQYHRNRITYPHLWQENFPMLMAVAGTSALVSSTTDIIPVISHYRTPIVNHPFKEASYYEEEIYRTIIDMGVAFNSIIRAETSPWAYCKYGAQYGFKNFQFQAAESSNQLSIDITQGNSDYYDAFINNTKQISANGITKAFPSRILISYENFPEIFDNPYAVYPGDSDSIVDVNPSDGQELTGIGELLAESSSTDTRLQSTVIALKDASVFAIDINTRQQQRLESQGQGCTAPDSIASSKDGVIFANETGIFRVGRSLKIDHIGKDLEGWWNENVNKSSLSSAVGYIDNIDQSYKLAVPIGTDTHNSVLLVYNFEREGVDQPIGSWTRYTGFDVTSFMTTATKTFIGTNAGDVLQVRRDGEDGDYIHEDKIVTATFTGPASGTTITVTSHGLSDGDLVKFDTAGASTIKTYLAYYVEATDSNTLTIYSEAALTNTVTCDWAASPTVTLTHINTSAILGILIYGAQSFGEPGIRKKVRKIITEFESETAITDVELLVATDMSEQFLSAGTHTFAITNTNETPGTKSHSVKYTPQKTRGNQYQVKITHGTKKEKLVICGLSFRVDGLTEASIKENSGN